MRLPGWGVLIWVLLLVGFGVYGFITLPTTVESSRLVKGVAAGWSVLTGLLLLAQFRWSPELFVATFLLFAAWGVSQLVAEGYTHPRLLMAVGPFVVLAGWYPSLRREIRKPATQAPPG
jgi:hypothetical protein